MTSGEPREPATHDGVAELRRLIEESRVRYRLDELVGMTVAEALAIVDGAGGQFVTDDGPITANFDTRRVVASVAEGRVTRVDIG
jgi:hypothetical protein